jgi:hypothetical protein
MHVTVRVSTAILTIIEGHETAFNGCEYQFTSGKPLKNLKLTVNYYENECTYFCIGRCNMCSVTHALPLYLVRLDSRGSGRFKKLSSLEHVSCNRRPTDE